MKQNIFTRVLEPILQSSHLLWEAQEKSDATTKAADFFFPTCSNKTQWSDRAKTFVQPVVPRFDGHYNY